MTQEGLPIYAPNLTMKEIRNRTLSQRLQQYGGSRTETAKSLGVSLRTVRNWIRSTKQQPVND